MNDNPYASPPVLAESKPPLRRHSNGKYIYKPIAGLLWGNLILATATLLISTSLTAMELSLLPFSGAIADRLLWGLVATALAWNVWYLVATYRVVANTHALTLEPPESSAGFAVGAYFIPILNLFKPYQIMKDCYIATGAEAGVLLGAWWGSHIVLLLMKQAVRQLSRLSASDTAAVSVEDISGLAVILNLINFPVLLVLAILSHLVLSRLAARHQEIMAGSPDVSSFQPYAPPSQFQRMSPWGGD